MSFYINVILPLHLPKPLTYSVDQAMSADIEIGKRVVVSLKSKFYTGLVYEIHPFAPQYVDHIKPIEYIFDEQPIVLPEQFRFWHWVSEYYMCSLGEVMSVALPSSLKLSSETIFQLNKEIYETLVLESLSDKERLLMTLLESTKKVSIKEIQNYLQQKTVLPLIKKWMIKNVIVIHEDISDKYRPKKVSFVEFFKAFTEEELNDIFTKLEKRSPKQQQVLLKFMQCVQDPNWIKFRVHKAYLLKQLEHGESALKALEKKNILRLVYQEESRFIVPPKDEPQIVHLNAGQTQALQEIKTGFQDKHVMLLHGVTSSGKTEVYIKLLEELILNGGQALFLLPEIALTSQMITRLRKYFGDIIGVYHSRLNDAERAEIWHKQRSPKPYSIILGTRSSLFLPFQNLALVIVDEEHETSYKQASPAPRYNARDSAIVLGLQMDAKLVLGSATPSIDSYYNAQQGKYGLAHMSERYHQAALPNIKLVDIRDLTRQKRMKSHFSDVLIQHIEQTLAQDQKVILFQNRRGFALFMQCESCDYIETCYQCDVSLTYHKQEHHLKCHYCGYTKVVEKACRSCGSFTLKVRGFGTEKVEEELGILFPQKRIARMDLDSTRGKHAFHRLIQEFEGGEIDILVGTQMITKGLDFKNVGLVAVLNADNLIHFPDFRTQERSFQLITQVAGRAGRHHQQADVLVQTYSPKYPLFEKIINYNYTALYQEELVERQNFHYPPFTRLIKITCRGKQEDVLEKSALLLSQKLKQHVKLVVLGPEYPLIRRIKNYYIQEILIKLTKSESLTETKQAILQDLHEFFSLPSHKYVRYSIDVDPL